MVESATTAARSRTAAGARPASQAPQLGALALAQLSGALRLVSADVQDEVTRYGDPQLVAAGKINVISLETVQQSFGERWNERKEEVFAFAQQVLRRSLGRRGIYLRVSDSDFFVIHPGLGRLGGQAACLRYARDILARFQVDPERASGAVLQVTRIGKGRLEAKAADAAHAEQALAAGQSDPDASAGPWPHDEASLTSHLIDRSAPFVSTDGRLLRVSASLEPIYELKSFTRIGFRMIRRIMTVSNGEALTAREVAALPSADLVRADLATIARGIDRLKVENGGEQHLSLIVPVSFTSLASQRGRAELDAPVRQASHMVKLGVICEIHDIEGVPAAALLDVTAMIRPLSLLVVGRLANPTPGAFARLAGAGFQALSFDCPPAAVGDAEFIGWANSMVTAARKVVRSVLVYRAGSTKRAGTLASLGATHVSLDAG